MTGGNKLEPRKSGWFFLVQVSTEGTSVGFFSGAGKKAQEEEEGKYELLGNDELGRGG